MGASFRDTLGNTDPCRWSTGSQNRITWMLFLLASWGFAKMGAILIDAGVKAVVGLHHLNVIISAKPQRSAHSLHTARPCHNARTHTHTITHTHTLPWRERKAHKPTFQELFAMGPAQFSWPRGVAENSFTKPGFWELFCRFFPGKTAKHRVH